MLLPCLQSPARNVAPAVPSTCCLRFWATAGACCWHEVSGDLPTDFGFAIDVHAHEPETIYVVPIQSDSLHDVHEGKLRVYRRLDNDGAEAVSTVLRVRRGFVASGRGC